MQYLNEKSRRSKLRLLKDENIVQINQKYGEPASINGNNTYCGGCIGCVNPNCLKYSDFEIGNIERLPDFSYERSYDVCPVNAMSFDENDGTIRIDKSKCINCGLCADRCPLGAIYCDGDTKVSECDSANYVLVESTTDNIESQKKQIEKLNELEREKKYRKENDVCLKKIYDQIQHFDGRSLVQNILIRNILISMGYNCAISRTGDVYTRMDGVYTNDNCFGVMEIEFGRDTLEASRGILDDVAVLESRFDIKKEDNTPLVICLSLPNKRQGYFQVVKDVQRVLNMRIQTITLGALLVLLWNGKVADFSTISFYADFDDMSIRDDVEKILGRSVNVSNSYLGIFEPEK